MSGLSGIRDKLGELKSIKHLEICTQYLSSSDNYYKIYMEIVIRLNNTPCVLFIENNEFVESLLLKLVYLPAEQNWWFRYQGEAATRPKVGRRLSS